MVLLRNVWAVFKEQRKLLTIRLSHIQLDGSGLKLTQPHKFGCTYSGHNKTGACPMEVRVFIAGSARCMYHQHIANKILVISPPSRLLEKDLHSMGLDHGTLIFVTPKSPIALCYEHRMAILALFTTASHDNLRQVLGKLISWWPSWRKYLTFVTHHHDNFLTRKMLDLANVLILLVVLISTLLPNAYGTFVLRLMLGGISERACCHSWYWTFTKVWCFSWHNKIRHCITF